MSARPDDPAQRFRRLFPAIGPNAEVLSLRAAAGADLEAVLTRPAAAQVKAVSVRPSP